MVKLSLHGDAWIERCMALEPVAKAAGARALAIGGSIGQQKANKHSDLDLFVVVNTEMLGEFLDIGAKYVCQHFGRIILFRGPILVAGFGYSFTALLDNFDMVQVNVNTANMLAPNYLGSLGSIILFDLDGDYARFLRESEGLEIDWIDKANQSMVFFWLRSVVVWKCIKASKMITAQRYFVDLQDQMFFLQRAVSRAVPSNPNNPVKGVEYDLKAEHVAEILRCSPANFTDGVSGAFLCALRWYVQRSSEIIHWNDDLRRTHETGQAIYRAVIAGMST